MPVGIVTQWRVGEPTEVARHGLRGQRESNTRTHQYETEDPPRTPKHTMKYRPYNPSRAAVPPDAPIKN